jgi:hypothetical protein
MERDTRSLRESLAWQAQHFAQVEVEPIKEQTVAHRTQVSFQDEKRGERKYISLDEKKVKKQNE